MRNFINIVEDLTNAPEVIKQAAAGNWPKVLQGEDLIKIRVLIDKGMESAEWFDIVYNEAEDDGEVEYYATDGTIAHLRLVSIEDLDMPEEGVADPELVDTYATATTKAPPIIVVGNELRDGNHRVAVARKKGQTHLMAYVIT